MLVAKYIVPKEFIKVVSGKDPPRDDGEGRAGAPPRKKKRLGKSCSAATRNSEDNLHHHHRTEEEWIEDMISLERFMGREK